MVDTLLVVAQYRVRIPASVTSSGVAQSDSGFVMFPAKIRFFILPETKHGIREAIRLGSAIDAVNPHQ